jgi:hypothetical protein
MSQERNGGSEIFSAPLVNYRYLVQFSRKEGFALPLTNLSEQKIQKQNELQIKTNRFYRCQME